MAAPAVTKMRSHDVMRGLLPGGREYDRWRVGLAERALTCGWKHNRVLQWPRVWRTKGFSRHDPRMPRRDCPFRRSWPRRPASATPHKWLIASWDAVTVRCAQ